MKDNMFSIGEVAKSVGITRRIILNYEALGLIKPDVKEGTSKNRYYTIDSLTKIRSIRIFQNLGLSLSEIRSYFEGSTDLMPLIQRLVDMRDSLNLNIEKLYERVNSESDRIKKICIEKQTVYRRTVRSKTIAQKSENLRNTALRAMQLYGTDITKRMYFIEYNINSAEEVSYCITVPAGSKGEGIATIPKTDAICMYHHGPYEDIPKTRRKLVDYAKENNLTVLGTCRHIYIEGPPQHKDKRLFITQIVLPVTRQNVEE